MVNETYIAQALKILLKLLANKESTRSMTVDTNINTFVSQLRKRKASSLEERVQQLKMLAKRPFIIFKKLSCLPKQQNKYRGYSRLYPQ